MLSANSVNYSYSGSNYPLIRNLDLTIETGSVCGILGANGAGKSTLLRLFGGFIGPDKGDCQVLGFKPTERLPAFLNKLFFLPEETLALPLTMRNYVFRFSPFYPDFDLDQFGSLASRFKLSDRKNLNEYSLGQKKKFFLSFGISTNARVLLLDEPTNGLDIPSKKEFQEVLRSHQSADRNILISTHQANDIEGLIDTLVIIDEGNVVLNETIDSISTLLTYSMEESVPQNAIFHEQIGNLFATLQKNGDGKRSHIDLRTLFGFVIHSPQAARDIFFGKEENERTVSIFRE